MLGLAARYGTKIALRQGANALARIGGGALVKRGAAAAGLAGGSALIKRFRGGGSSAAASGGAYSVLTNQYDVKNFYRKRYMPRRKKRAWRRFYKKVASVYRKETSGKSSLLLRGKLDGTVATDQQGVIGCMLYGASKDTSSTDIGCQDQNYIQDAVGGSGTTNISPLCKSAVMDIEITNRGIADYNNPLTVDVYKIKCIRTCQGVNNVQVLGWSDLFGQALAMEPTCGGATDIGANNVAGVTPWMAADFCRHVKIQSHKRIILSQGQTAEFMLRDPRDRKLFWENPNQTKASALEKGIVQGYMFIIQGIAGTGIQTAACSYSITCNRTYQISNTADNVKRGGYRDAN